MEVVKLKRHVPLDIDQFGQYMKLTNGVNQGARVRRSPNAQGEE